MRGAADFASAAPFIFCEAKAGLPRVHNIIIRIALKVM